jgi:hypothetical protein
MRRIGRPIAEGMLDAPFYSFRRQALGDSARQSHLIPTLSLTWVKAFERAQPRPLACAASSRRRF